MSNSTSIWYAGRVSQRRGQLGIIDALACESTDGWQPLPNPRKLFPRSGQVEITGLKTAHLQVGDWLAFQVVSNTRPGSASYKVTAHRLLPRYADLSTIGSLEAVRVLFTKDGWDGAQSAGTWAVRYGGDRVLVLQLERERGATRLRVAPSSISSIRCYEFEPARIINSPTSGEATELYELDGAEQTAVHDWSPGADYIAHVIRALAGADDPRLPELITWLELHREEETGRISATGADQEKAFEALRSGELAARLSADRELMAAYLAAVKDDPAVAKAVSEAAAVSADHERSKLLAELRAELDAEIEKERAQQEKELENHRLELETSMKERLVEQEKELSREIQDRAGALERAAEEEARNRATELEAELAATINERERASAECAALYAEANELKESISSLEGKLALLDSEVEVRSASLPRPSSNSEFRPALLDLDVMEAEQTIDLEGLKGSITNSTLLTSGGKSAMSRFLAYMLAGEIPIVEGASRDEFILVAESLFAAGKLIQFDADETVLTVEDIWSRAGSGFASAVGQAAQLSRSADTSTLVELRGIDRSAARFWYPALRSFAHRGYLPRRLLIFATLIDPEADEAKALPENACRLQLSDPIRAGASLVAPSIIGGGVGAVRFNLNPGPRPSDLSIALPVLAELDFPLDVPTSLRVARVLAESVQIRSLDHAALVDAARAFCRDTNQNSTSSASETNRA